MNLITEWDNADKTILRVTYHPGWTWDDLQANGPIEREFLDSVEHKVDVIADFRGTQLPPNAIVRLPQIAASPPYTHPNSGLMVMVGSPAFMDEVVSVYRRVYGAKARKLHVLPDLESARRQIAELNRQASDDKSA
jgi:hypothetical protein